METVILLVTTGFLVAVVVHYLDSSLIKTKNEMAEGWEELFRQERERAQALLDQVGDLAQQLATLRVEKGAVPEEREYIKAEPPKPLSEELRAFLDGITNAEARRMVEEEIDYYRAQGLVDEQIHKIVSQT